ncbi:MAG: 16S rRNA (cytidine(1402)-2'-O)-methyltransferase [Flavobacteriaceae bacterium]|nr:16S rRNA (cytidine(1402)-2'-O)-methyltransferase [Flavobacteriaceae bacterium]
MSKLFLVPTPIGNLQDMTFRSVEVLKEVDLILAEDTRTSGKLLKHFSIETPMKAYHMHNEHQLIENLVQQLEGGTSMALISDAGTPGISDPGFLLVRACVEHQIEVICLPGANAVLPALVTSGIPCDKFVFEGFLPPKKGRKTRLEFLANEERTLVFYESPYKINKTLKDLITYFGEARKACLSREISKLYEEKIRGSLKEVLAISEARKLKGEMVLVVEGK